MTLPLVSVLTPSFNQGQWLFDCLRSVDRQAYPNIEHIVVDAGSTDQTHAILSAYSGRPLRSVVRPGCSQGEALNIALELSRGSIIGWLNTDDAYFGVDSVALAVHRLLRSPRKSVVYGDGALVDEQGRFLRHVRCSHERLPHLGAASPLLQPAAFMHRDSIDGRFISGDVELLIDYELWLRLNETHTFVKVPRILAIDRDHPGRRTRCFASEFERDHRRFALDYGRRVRRARLPELLRKWRDRLVGVPHALRLEADYEFALPLELDRPWKRLLRQAFLPQRFLRAI